MAQQVERVLGKDEVTGSNPVSSSKSKIRAHLAPFFVAPAYPDRRFEYTLRKAVFVCFLRERRSARNRSPSLLHLKSGKNVNFSLPIRFERG